MRLGFTILAALALLAASCSSDIPEGMCELSFRFAPGYGGETRSSSIILPDTNDFILTVSDSRGNPIYSGLYGERPQSLRLAPGSYLARVISREFNVPAFDAYQFGDEVCFTLESGARESISFVCRQINSGIRLVISPEFVARYDGGVIFLSSGDGRLMYGYAEKRIAFFNPGPVSLQFLYEQEQRTLFTRVLDPREILTVNLGTGDSPQDHSQGIRISVDTTRVWNDYNYDFGNNSGESVETALTVDEARGYAPKDDVWVVGYIVGGDLTSTGISFLPPFHTYTNFAIASDRNERNRDACLSVSLPVGDDRDRLNLVDNPDLLGKRIYLQGDLVESYFGLPGIKNITDYKF